MPWTHDKEGKDPEHLHNGDDCVDAAKPLNAPDVDQKHREVNAEVDQVRHPLVRVVIVVEHLDERDEPLGC